jgi:signal transduction histidine kinase
MESSHRQTAGLTTSLAVRYVRARAGEDGVHAMLRLAGDRRSPEDLDDERAWSTYDQKVALWEAAAEVLGDSHVSRHMGETAVSEKGGAALKVLLRALGSPGQVLRRIAQTAPKFSTVCTMEALEVGKASAVIAYRLHDGFEPNRFDCEYNVGLISQVTVLFGLPPAMVEHSECQVTGADRCVYRVRWQRRHRVPWRRRRMEIEHLRNQLAAVTERTESLQSTIADLVSPADVDTVLARIATRAGPAVGAQRYILAVRPTEESPLRVHADGFARDEAERCAADLLGEQADDDPSRLVVDVVSARRAYGKLAAFYDEGFGFFPEERSLLAAYARHAAVALDVATALDAARERGATAELLLRLVGVLAGGATPDDVAARLAEAVPPVVGADRARVLLWEEEGRKLVYRAAYGHAPAVRAELLGQEIRADESPEVLRWLTHPEPKLYTREEEDPFVLGILNRFGSSAIFMVPIMARGELLGVVVADVASGSPPMAVTPGLSARLSGLADQAAIAIQNARLLEQEREAVERLRAADRLKTEFVAMVSHELRSPLAVIVGAAKTIQAQAERIGEEERDQLLDAVVRRSEQLRRLVEDLLQSTRELKLHLAETDAATLVRDAVDELCTAHPGIEVACHVDGPLPVVADATRVRQVIDNLLTNALKYAPGTPIEVSAVSRRDHVEIVVADHGPGMTEEQAARVFEPFYQAPQHAVRRAGGVGLGLHIARRIAEAHGGSISLRTAPDEGTAITISLPVEGPLTPTIGVASRARSEGAPLGAHELV